MLQISTVRRVFTLFKRALEIKHKITLTFLIKKFMTMAQFLDLDDILYKFASERVGSEFTVDKIDTSKVEIKQRSLLYHSSKDWWTKNTEYEQYFDNDKSTAQTYTFSFQTQFKTSASWSVVKAFRSAKLLPYKLRLDYPVSASSDNQPLHVVFDVATLDQQVRKVNEGNSNWQVSEDVTVGGHSSALCKAQFHMCRLQNVSFSVDLLFSGTLRIHGHKRSKQSKKVDLSVSVVDALQSPSNNGFSIIENSTDPTVPARQACFQFEGVCSGEVPVDMSVATEQISSLV